MLCEDVHEQVLEFLVRAGWVALGSAEYAAVCVVFGRVAGREIFWSVHVQWCKQDLKV